MAALMKATIILLVSILMCIKGAEAESYGGSKSLKKMEVSVYYHDRLNVTDVIVAQAPSMPGAITTSEAPFGMLFFVNDPLTEGPDPASARLGNLTGSFFASSLYYGSDYMNSLVLTFSKNSSPSNPELRGLHGTLTVSGITSASHPQPQPITGGTGSFAFVLGSLTMVPIDISTFTQVLRLDLVLYWPPFSPSSS